MDADEFHAIFNYVEAGFWAVIGLGFLIAHLQKKPHTLLPALLFVAFGVTDVIEVRTGAWWRPWWLAVAKCACPAALGLCLFAHYRRTAKNPRPGREG